MKLQNEFTVPASVERAWKVLLDVERVAPCLPGAALTGSEGDEHRGTMTVKIGPITSRYEGTVRIEEADPAARRAVMRARARDSRGQGSAAAMITSTMEEVDGGTRVRVETDLRISGPAAQFGRGVMQDVSAKLMGRFADCLAQEIGGGEAAPPAAEEGGGAGTPPSEPVPAPVEPAAPGARTVGPINPAANPPPGPAGDSAAAAAAPPPARPRPTEEVLDLGEASREAVLKRVLPVAAGMAALILLLWRRNRR